MNNRGSVPPNDQSALSLLVNAAEGRDPPRMQRDLAGRSLAETLRLRGLAGDPGAAALEEQLFLQQSQAFGGQAAWMSQFRDHNILAQYAQQPHLSSLFALGGAPGPSNADMRNALAAAQLRHHAQAQAPQLTQADLLALSRSGALPGLSGLLGGSGLGGAGLASEIEGLQRLEELERRQRLLSAAGAAPVPSSAMNRVETPQEASQMSSIAPSSGKSQPTESARADSNVVAAQPRATAKPNERRPSDTADSNNVCTEVPPKEEVEKTPGSVIVPCRARGMPMDHNFKTAYFVIPENVKHGEELICSYFACRNAGIKFRYCSHCKVPVAKRNFRKRHKHGGEIAAGEDSGDDDNSVKKPVPSQITTPRNEDVDGMSSQSADSERNHGSKVRDDVVQDRKPQSGPKPSNARNESREEVATSPTRPLKPEISSDRKQRWAELLENRPSTKNEDAMSNWLMEVLAVSDLDTPLKAEGNSGKQKAVLTASVEAGNPSYTSADGEGVDRSNGSNFGGSLIVKKKRPAESMLKKNDNEGDKAAKPFAGKSFAEWKERKKQRKQVKSSSPCENDED